MANDFTKNWVVMKANRRPSRYGGEIHEITFANTDFEIAHTYIDEDNRNFRQWSKILEAVELGAGVVVSGLKPKKNAQHKKTGEPLINADSIVRVVHVEERIDDLLREFEHYLEIE